jgi:Molydopterin dinucleotide binding domain/Major Facilitator Superfamily
MYLRDFARSGHPPTLFSAFLYFDISFMVWVLIGALGVYIAKDLGLTASQKGMLVAIPILGGSLFRIAMGMFTDHIGPKKTGTIGQLIVLLPLFWGWHFRVERPCRDYPLVLTTGRVKNQWHTMTRTGKLVAHGRVTTEIAPGTCFAPFHWGRSAGSYKCANNLTLDACDPVSKEPELKAAAVRVKKLEGLQSD